VWEGRDEERGGDRVTELDIRRFYMISEETLIEGGRSLELPLRRVAVAAVIVNPLAGAYGEDLEPLIDFGETLGRELTRRALMLLGGVPAESFGKAAIVGMDGELEHAAALLHPKFGAPMREAIGGGKALIPSAKKMGGPGTAIDVPLHYKDAMMVRSHFDAFEVRVPAAPRDDEIVVVAALTSGGRPWPRVGGLRREDVVGADGLR
jgi:hypothetical protein